jgi:hypothetical protein
MGFGCQSASSRYEAATISKRFPSLSRGRRDSAATRVLFKRSLRCTSHSYTHILAGQTTQSIKASAVWFCSRDPHLWDLRNERWQPKLIKNPWANHPIPDELLPLPGYKLNDENEFESTTGTTFADILGLPEVWSPKEEPDCGVRSAYMRAGSGIALGASSNRTRRQRVKKHVFGRLRRWRFAVLTS